VRGETVWKRQEISITYGRRLNGICSNLLDYLWNRKPRAIPIFQTTSEGVFSEVRHR
jgi:hypothetical protein